jgi:B9 domain-containing protein 2
LKLLILRTIIFKKLKISTWRPSGSVREAITQFYVGGGHQLRNPDLLSSGSDRFRLTTTAMGKVHLQIGVIQRNFDKFGIEC